MVPRSAPLVDWWSRTDVRSTSVVLVDGQWIVQPGSIDQRMQESRSLPILLSIPQESDPAAVGRMLRTALAHSEVIPDDPTVPTGATSRLGPLPVCDVPLPFDVGGDDVPWGDPDPPGPQGPDDGDQGVDAETAERWAALEAIERSERPVRLLWRLAGCDSSTELDRNALTCTVGASPERIETTPLVIERPGHPECNGFHDVNETVSVPADADDETLGLAVRRAFDGARNPWLPFTMLCPAAEAAEEPAWRPWPHLHVHGATMDRAGFWETIRQVRHGRPKFDGPYTIDQLVGLLSGLEPREIADFEKHYLDLHDEAYDARLLEVLWILTGGGPGDEGLNDFVGWLILQGRKTFEAILKKPESLPEKFPPGTDVYCGGLGHVAREAYENTTGRDDFDTFYERLHGEYVWPEAPHGADHDPRTEDEDALAKRLKNKYAKLWKKYFAEYDR